MRTHTNDTSQNIGETVILKGWVHGRRDHGKLIFIDLRDRWGIIQVVFAPSNNNLLAIASDLRSEWVIEITGLVKERPQGMQNPELPNGHIEVEAKQLIILSEARTPPFTLDTDGYEIGEEHRLTYRYLDLRRQRLLKNMILRDNIISYIRTYLHANDFIEIETPILTKSTPEGARDYVVPSRLYTGNFYALPQSPQQYKQLLMVAGIERYFQIARCFRDEDTRGDRQPEHTQLDIEMSFVEREDVLSLLEDLMIQLVKKIAPEKRITKQPFPRLSYKDAVAEYNSDKPDLRENKNDPNELAFCWIIDFPMFEKENDTGKWTYGHNPFSGIREDSIKYLLQGEHLDHVISHQYDLALNGLELGSGSIRNHRPELLQKVFEILGHSQESIKQNFGHMLDAFSYGVPPHGGMAWGLDRIVMLLAKEPNIREVIAFPKTGDGRDLMMNAPAEIPEKHLAELSLKVIKK